MTPGAITATVDALRRPADQRTRHLGSIIDRVTPSVEPLLTAGTGLEHSELIHQAVRANIRVSADHLRHGSELLERMIRDKGLMVVGAEYSLETGVVEFFEGVSYPGS